jgi:hypothetical protein
MKASEETYRLYSHGPEHIEAELVGHFGGGAQRQEQSKAWARIFDQAKRRCDPSPDLETT